MCSLSDNLSLNDRLGNKELEQASISEICESTVSLMLEERNMEEIFRTEDKSLCETCTNSTHVITPHRRDVIDGASTYVNELSLTQTKIADKIEIQSPGSVTIGPVINIIEQIVIDPENNKLEYGFPKLKDYNDYFTMVDRMHWLAQPSVGDMDYVQKPTTYVIICHTATQEAFTQAENVLMLRLLQTFHIESQGWSDIAYNFCIGSDGNVYEGRGWTHQGSHSAYYNKYSIGIAFIGCFLNHLPPKTALKRCQDLIAHGVKIGAISPDYELIGHCQCRPFLSPGQCLFDEIKTWKNFNPHVTSTSPCILKP